MSRWGTSWEFQLNCQFLYSIQALSNIFSNFIQIVLVYYFIFWYIVYHILLIYSYSLAQQYDDMCDNQLMTREHSEQMHYDVISKCARSMKKIEHKKWPKGRSQKVCSHLVITSSQLIKTSVGSILLMMIRHTMFWIFSLISFSKLNDELNSSHPPPRMRS